MMRHPAKILETYQIGDHINDDELEALRSEMQALADASWRFGDLFRLQAAYAQKVADDCRSFLRSRQERAARVAAQ